MTNKRMANVNLFDAMVGLIILAVVAIVIFGLSYKTEVKTEAATLSVIITEGVTEIENEVNSSLEKEIYMNGLREPVILTSAERSDETLVVGLSGDGYINDGVYIFNGQRVLVGQKIELHGIFFARGVITEVEYESSK